VVTAGCGSSGRAESPNEQLGVRVPWIKAAPAEGGRAVRLGYQVDPCTRARRARVQVEEREVKVTLGDSKRDPKKACVGVVERHCALVDLPEPIGSRKVVDGAVAPRARSHGRPIGDYGRCETVPLVSG
jgi:hypothetical protein